MVLYFYKGKGNFFNSIIRWWTKSKYSHVEIVIYRDGSYHWFSSANWDGGVRIKKKKKYNPNKWDKIFIGHIPNCNDTNSIFEWFRKREGLEYDYLGLLTFCLDFLPTTKKRYFCSEAVMESLGFDKAETFSPGDVYRIFSNLAKNKK